MQGFPNNFMSQTYYKACMLEDRVKGGNNSVGRFGMFFDLSVSKMRAREKSDFFYCEWQKLEL